MLRASTSSSSSIGFQGGSNRYQHHRLPILSPKKSRLFHDDQPYLALTSPTSSSSSLGSINSLLPFPPSSPSRRRTRFRFSKPAAAIRSFRLFLKESPPIVWLSFKLSGFSTVSPAVWVLLYFVFNLSLTLYNKYVLNHFPFPYTLTSLHALCGTIGTFAMLHLELVPDQPPIPSLDLREGMVVVLFSLLYTVNILVSNASLKLVTVPFHQVVRGSSPLFTIALSVVLFKQGCSRAKLVSLLPVIVGVGFATYGDYYCTLFGFLLTLLGTFLAALKTVVTNLFLRTTSSSKPPSHDSDNPPKDPKEAFFSSKHPEEPSILKFFEVPDAYHRHRVFPSTPFPPSSWFHPLIARLSLPKLSLTPIQLLYLMSPLAFIQTALLAYFTGELSAVNRHLSVPSHHHQFIPGLSLFGFGMPSWWIVMNGVMAFGLNVVSFYSNKRIGPVGMSVAANVKQVLTILCAVVLFDLTITAANGVGIVLTLLGGAWYAQLEVKEKNERRKRTG